MEKKEGAGGNREIGKRMGESGNRVTRIGLDWANLWCQDEETFQLQAVEE